MPAPASAGKGRQQDEAQAGEDKRGGLGCDQRLLNDEVVHRDQVDGGRRIVEAQVEAAAVVDAGP